MTSKALNDAADRAAKICSLLNEAGKLAQKQADPELEQITGDAALMAWESVQELSQKTGRPIETTS